MPRRLRFTVIAVTVLVMMLLMAFAVFSWTAVEPLRFRVVAQGPVEPAGPEMMFASDGEPVIPFEIEVENTMPFAIHLRHAEFYTHPLDLIRENGEDPLVDSFEPDSTVSVGWLNGTYRDGTFNLNSGGVTLPSAALPAHGVRRHRLLVSEEVARRLDWSKVRSRYDWESRTKCFVARLLLWTRDALGSSSLARRIPIPQEDQHETFVEDRLPKS